MNKSRRNKYNLPFGKASRTATRSNRNPTVQTGDKNDSVHLNDGQCSNATFNGKPVVTDAYQKDAFPVKKLGDNDGSGNDAFPFIQGVSHSQLPHPNQLLQARKQKKNTVQEKEKGFPNINSHLYEVKSKFARTVSEGDRETPAVPHYKYLESDVKENLPDYKKEIHRSTELKLSALTSKKFEKKLNPPMQSISPLASSLPENDYTSEVHLLSTSTSDDHPSGTAVVESWEEVEEVIHKRWKHKHWLSLPGERHLPEQ